MENVFSCVDILNIYYKINCCYMQFVYNLNSSPCASMMLSFSDSICYLFGQESMETTSCFETTCCCIVDEHSKSRNVLRKERD